MPRALILSSVTAAFLLASSGLVQAQQGNFREVEDDALLVQPYNLSVDDLEDMNIVTTGGEDVGEVEEVLVDAAGNLAIAADVGGFLGIGGKRVVLSLDQLRLQGDQLITDLTKEQVEALPEWDD